VTVPCASFETPLPLLPLFGATTTINRYEMHISAIDCTRLRSWYNCTKLVVSKRFLGFSAWRKSVTHTVEVAGSSPVPPTSRKYSRNQCLDYLPTVGSAALNRNQSA
jgi:hypothetical protein